MSVDTKFYELEDKAGKRYLLDSHLDALGSLNCFMQKVIYEEEMYFTNYTTKTGKQVSVVSSIGKHLRALHVYSEIFTPDYTFSPLLTFFFEHYRKHPMRDRVVQATHRSDIICFDNFIAVMRKDALAINLKKFVADWNSKSKKNSLRLIKFQNELFKRHSRLIAIRLDLSYRPVTFTGAEIDSIMSQHGLQKHKDWTEFYEEKSTPSNRPITGRVGLEVVQTDRKRFFTNMKGKTSLFKHLVGYVWTVEHERIAGYHMHVMLFFDAAYTQMYDFLAQAIGSYWSNEITSGRGYFENRSTRNGTCFDSWTSGEVCQWDTAKRKILDQALQYFCKKNQMIQVVPYSGCHLFGSGFMHRKTKSIKRSHRKVVENSLSTVRIFA